MCLSLILILVDKVTTYAQGLPLTGKVATHAHGLPLTVKVIPHAQGQPLTGNLATYAQGLSSSHLPFTTLKRYIKSMHHLLKKYILKISLLIYDLQSED